MVIHLERDINMNTKLSISLKKYLLTIYKIQSKNNEVHLSDVASYMKVSKPSANNAVHNLVVLGLVTHQTYGPLRITKTGTITARNILEKENLVKNFLINQLDLCDEIAETDAANISHVISQQTIEKIKYRLSSNI